VAAFAKAIVKSITLYQVKAFTDFILCIFSCWVDLQGVLKEPKKSEIIPMYEGSILGSFWNGEFQVVLKGRRGAQAPLLPGAFSAISLLGLFSMSPCPHTVSSKPLRSQLP
jgi:hypothetical protein